MHMLLFKLEIRKPIIIIAFVLWETRNVDFLFITGNGNNSFLIPLSYFPFYYSVIDKNVNSVLKIFKFDFACLTCRLY